MGQHRRLPDRNDHPAYRWPPRSNRRCRRIHRPIRSGNPSLADPGSARTVLNSVASPSTRKPPRPRQRLARPVHGTPPGLIGRGEMPSALRLNHFVVSRSVATRQSRGRQHRPWITTLQTTLKRTSQQNQRPSQLGRSRSTTAVPTADAIPDAASAAASAKKGRGGEWTVPSSCGAAAGSLLPTTACSPSTS